MSNPRRSSRLSTHSAWSRITSLFSRSSSRSLSSCRYSDAFSIQTTGNATHSTATSRYSLQLPYGPAKSDPSEQHELTSSTAPFIPPFSPTYCKPNEFSYSNFYIRMPNGKWMVRYRSGNRVILGTDELDSYMI